MAATPSEVVAIDVVVVNDATGSPYLSATDGSRCHPDGGHGSIQRSGPLFLVAFCDGRALLHFNFFRCCRNICWMSFLLLLLPWLLSLCWVVPAG